MNNTLLYALTVPLLTASNGLAAAGVFGRWVAPGSGRSTGTGLHSVERRLRLLVGPGAKVTHEEQDGWVRVRVRVPVVSTEQEHNEA